MKTKPATIKDIAQMANCSYTTVSFVLNNVEGKVSEATKQRVLDAVNKLNYVSNRAAVSLVTKKAKVIGLIIPDNTNTFFSEFSKYVEIAARKEGYSVVYGNTDNSIERDTEYLKTFAAGQTDGIIYTPSSAFGDAEAMAVEDIVANSNIPIIVVDRQIGNLDADVVLDQVKGGYMATKYLIDSGHRVIGAYTGSENSSSSNGRLEGYKLALKSAGINFREDLIFRGDYRLGNEKEALKHFLDNGATALFCFNDVMALGIYKEARRMNVLIPEDLSVVGFDNTMMSEIVYPELTTISQPIKDMANATVDKLLSEMQSPIRSVKQSLFQPELIIRKSVKKI